MIPRHKNKRFKSDADFQEWLKKNTKFIIHFEDHGQDFLKWYLDDAGEVLHSMPFQSSVWNGAFVNVFNLEIGECPELLETEFNSEKRIMNYRLIDIEVKHI